MAQVYQDKGLQQTQKEAEQELTASGLDAAVIAGLKAGDAMAMSAASAIMGNAAVQQLMGLGGRAIAEGAETAQDVEDAAEVVSGPLAEPERVAKEDWQEAQSESREPVYKGGEGHGTHGRLDPVEADFVNWAFWLEVADVAEMSGLVTAAAHMRHFLGNSGEKLEVDLYEIGARSPVLMSNVEAAQNAAVSSAVVRLSQQEELDHQVFRAPSLERGGKQTEFARSESEDLYLAIAGNEQKVWSTCVFEPDFLGGGTLLVETTLRLWDEYNWDVGKSTEIAGVTVSDATLGRLHSVGLAQEFPIRGRRVDQRAYKLSAAQLGMAGSMEVLEGGGPKEKREPTGRLDSDRESGR